MTDFRQANNPEPFTDMTLERDTRPLTDGEKTEIRYGLSQMRSLVSRFYGDLPRMERGTAAAELNRLTGIIRRMRSALLEFPDKPDQEKP